MSAANDTRTNNLTVPAEEACRRLSSGAAVLVLDVRSLQDWQSCRLKVQGAIRVPPDAVNIDPGWLKDRFTLVYGGGPDEEVSKRIVRQLRGQGFQNVYALEGGFDAWRALACPVEPEEVDQEDPRIPAEVMCPDPDRLPRRNHGR